MQAAYEAFVKADNLFATYPDYFAYRQLMSEREVALHIREHGVPADGPSKNVAMRAAGEIRRALKLTPYAIPIYIRPKNPEFLVMFAWYASYGRYFSGVLIRHTVGDLVEPDADLANLLVPASREFLKPQGTGGLFLPPVLVLMFTDIKIDIPRTFSNVLEHVRRMAEQPGGDGEPPVFAASTPIDMAVAQYVLVQPSPQVLAREAIRVTEPRQMVAAVFGYFQSLETTRLLTASEIISAALVAATTLPPRKVGTSECLLDDKPTMDRLCFDMPCWPQTVVN